MQFDITKWSSSASKINPKPHPKIQNTFFSLLRFIHKTQWDGACHASSAILYLLLQEQNFNAKLYVGEVGSLPIVFDHSWVEIDNKIYDAAILSTLIDGISFSPVLVDIDLATGHKTKNDYGINSGQGYDPIAHQIMQTPFNVYMSNFPGHPKGLWGLTKEIGRNIGVKINLGRVNSKYSNTIWNEKT